MYTTVTDYFSTLSQAMNSLIVTDRAGVGLDLDDGAERAVQTILEVESNQLKVMLAGNGGSASIVSHVQNDLLKRAGVKAMVFTEQPLLLALANDDGFETVYEWPVIQWAETGDLMITLSSSGRSENILRAAHASLQKGCRLITLSGFSEDNPLRVMGDINFYVRSDSYGYVETTHAALTHFLTDRVMTIKNPNLR